MTTCDKARMFFIVIPEVSDRESKPQIAGSSTGHFEDDGWR